VNVEHPPQASPTPTSSAVEPSAEVDDAAGLNGYAEIAAQAKRIVWPCCILGLIAVVASVFVKAPFAGPGVCIGLALGMINARLLQKSVLRRFQAATGRTVQGSRFLASGLTRLAGITAVAVVLTLIERPLGIGVVIGLAVYQVVLLGASAVVMYRQVRA
jgi:hypothetical protein